MTIASVEDTGARSGFVPDRKTLRIPLDKWEDARKETFVYTAELKTATGNFRFVATVRDVATDRVAIASLPIRVE